MMRRRFCAVLLLVFFGLVLAQAPEPETCALDLFQPFRLSCALDEPPPTPSAPPAPEPELVPEVEEDLPNFLSFEEWKALQLAAGPPPSDPTSSGPSSSPEASAGAVLLPPISPSAASSPTPQILAPHLLIPLTDRYNYASDDCSARIHASSSGSKNPSAILSAKKDRYMLFRCDAAEKWIELELCDHIWVDTLQLANYEFFSGVFRSVSLYVADRYPPGPEGWVLAGTFEARNVRAVQSFHPAKEGFYRFVRLEFGSFWGGEWWCPVSIVRVFGLNEMEEWKRDGWEREAKVALEKAVESEAVKRREEQESEASRTMSVEVVRVETEKAAAAAAVEVAEKETAKRQATMDAVPTLAASTPPTDPPVESTPTPPSSDPMTATPSEAASSTYDAATVSSSPSTAVESTDIPPGTQEFGPATTPTQATVIQSLELKHTTSSTVTPTTSTTETDRVSSSSEVESTAVASSEALSESATIEPSSTSISSQSSTPVPTSTPSSSLAPDTPVSSGSGTSASLTTPAQPLASSSSSSQPTHTLSLSAQPPPPPPASSASSPSPSSSPSSSQGTESIYRTIMNRLSLLELNTTLGTRYMEEQSRMMREAFRKLERGVEERVHSKVGGWEGEWRGVLEGLSKQHQDTLRSAIDTIEAQREKMDAERASLVSQIHMLENEVTLEKRLSVAQLCLLLVVLFLLALTRGPDWGAISNALRPLSHSYSHTPGEVVEISTPERRSSVVFPTSPLRPPPTRLGPSSPRSGRTGPVSPRPSRPTSAASLPYPSGIHSPRRRVTGPHLSAGPKRLARTAHLHELRRVGRGAEEYGDDDDGDTRGRERRRPSDGTPRRDENERQKEDVWEDTDLEDERTGQVARETRGGVEEGVVRLQLGTPRRRVVLREVGNEEVAI